MIRGFDFLAALVSVRSFFFKGVHRTTCGIGIGATAVGQGRLGRYTGSFAEIPLNFLIVRILGPARRRLPVTWPRHFRFVHP